MDAMCEAYRQLLEQVSPRLVRSNRQINTRTRTHTHTHAYKHAHTATSGRRRVAEEYWDHTAVPGGTDVNRASLCIGLVRLECCMSCFMRSSTRFCVENLPRLTPYGSLVAQRCGKTSQRWRTVVWKESWHGMCDNFFSNPCDVWQPLKKCILPTF